MEPEGLDLSKNLMPLTHYPTRREVLDNCFNIIRGDVFKKMVPEQFRDMPEGDLKEKLANQMDGLSRKRINHILQVYMFLLISLEWLCQFFVVKIR